jgi:hypothetical protein
MRRVGKFMAKKRCCVKERCLVVCDCLVVDHDAIRTPAGADDDGGCFPPCREKKRWPSWFAMLS